MIGNPHYDGMPAFASEAEGCAPIPSFLTPGVLMDQEHEP
jgi:hypothetical protein